MERKATVFIHKLAEGLSYAGDEIPDATLLKRTFREAIESSVQPGRLKNELLFGFNLYFKKLLHSIRRRTPSLSEARTSNAEPSTAFVVPPPSGKPSDEVLFNLYAREGEKLKEQLPPLGAKETSSMLLSRLCATTDKDGFKLIEQLLTDKEVSLNQLKELLVIVVGQQHPEVILRYLSLVVTKLNTVVAETLQAEDKDQCQDLHLFISNLLMIVRFRCQLAGMSFMSHWKPTLESLQSALLSMTVDLAALAARNSDDLRKRSQRMVAQVLLHLSHSPSDLLCVLLQLTSSPRDGEFIEPLYRRILFEHPPLQTNFDFIKYIGAVRSAERMLSSQIPAEINSLIQNACHRTPSNLIVWLQETVPEWLGKVWSKSRNNGTKEMARFLVEELDEGDFDQLLDLLMGEESQDAEVDGLEEETKDLFFVDKSQDNVAGVSADGDEIIPEWTEEAGESDLEEEINLADELLAELDQGMKQDTGEMSGEEQEDASDDEDAMDISFMSAGRRSPELFPPAGEISFEEKRALDMELHRKQSPLTPRTPVTASRQRKDKLGISPRKARTDISPGIGRKSVSSRTGRASISPGKRRSSSSPGKERTGDSLRKGSPGKRLAELIHKKREQKVMPKGNQVRQPGSTEVGSKVVKRSQGVSLQKSPRCERNGRDNGEENDSDKESDDSNMDVDGAGGLEKSAVEIEHQRRRADTPAKKKGEPVNEHYRETEISPDIQVQGTCGKNPRSELKIGNSLGDVYPDAEEDGVSGDEINGLEAGEETTDAGRREAGSRGSTPAKQARRTRSLVAHSTMSPQGQAKLSPFRQRHLRRTSMPSQLVETTKEVDDTGDSSRNQPGNMDNQTTGSLHQDTEENVSGALEESSRVTGRAQTEGDDRVTSAGNGQAEGSAKHRLSRQMSPRGLEGGRDDKPADGGQGKATSDDVNPSDSEAEVVFNLQTAKDRERQLKVRKGPPNPKIQAAKQRYFSPKMLRRTRMREAKWGEVMKGEREPGGGQDGAVDRAEEEVVLSSEPLDGSAGKGRLTDGRPPFQAPSRDRSRGKSLSLSRKRPSAPSRPVTEVAESEEEGANQDPAGRRSVGDFGQPGPMRRSQRIRQSSTSSIESSRGGGDTRRQSPKKKPNLRSVRTTSK